MVTRIHVPQGNTTAGGLAGLSHRILEVRFLDRHHPHVGFRRMVGGLPLVLEA